jgi:uncharacterized protein YgbK (DUF1537 family)
MGRIVEAGVLRVTTDATFGPIEIAGWLRSHGAPACRHVPPGAIAEAIEQGRFVSLDALCADDLADIAAELLGMGRRILWAGSAGLAAALAARMGTGAAAPAPRFARGPVLFCLGSNHPVTIEQERRLLEARNAVLLHAGSAAPDQVSGAIQDCRHVVLRIPRGAIGADCVRRLIGDCRPAALLLSGGDTAALVCRAAGARAIALQRELAPGIPAGFLDGGVLDGIPVVTKSGGFGAPDDLIRIADNFYA